MPFTGDTYALPAGSGSANGVLSDASQINIPFADIATALSTVKAGNSAAALKANNLSDLGNAVTARTNLGATTTGSTVFTAASPAIVRNALGTPTYVATIAEMKALDVTLDGVAILTAQGRAGTFFLADYSTWSAVVTADTLEGYAIRSTSDPAKVWVRTPNYAAVLPYAQRPEWYGGKNDNSADAQPAIQCAIDVAYSLDTALNNEPHAAVIAGAGYWQTGASITAAKAMKLHIDGLIYYTPTTGSAVILGSDTTQHQHFDVSLGLVRAINGNGATPSSVNASGCTGVEIRKAQFSHIKIGGAIAFTKYGVWFNSSNDQFTGQHIQDCTFSLDLIAYNGAGVLAESVSAATGAFQVNRVYIQNSFANFRNVEIGVAADNNTNNNSWVIYACDNAHASGTELRVFGSYNDIFMGYGDSNVSVTLDAISYYNTIRIGREQGQVSLTDSGSENQVTYADGTTFGTVRFKNSGTTTMPLSVESTDASSSLAYLVELYRNSASPAANDGGVSVNAYFNNDGASKILGGRIRTDMPTVSAGNENLRFVFDTIVGGTLANRVAIWQGLSVGAPTGGDQGIGTINAANRIYQNANPLPYRLEGTATYDPASIAAGASTTTTVTVAGAALGDIALASFSVALGGLTISPWVSAADTVAVFIKNETGAPIDLGSGTLKAWVLK